MLSQWRRYIAPFCLLTAFTGALASGEGFSKDWDAMNNARDQKTKQAGK